MSQFLDFPPIEALPASATFTGQLVASPIVGPVTLTAAALAPFEAVRADMLALAKRYERVEFDVSTPAGLADAKKARLDLRENGRFRVQRAGDQFKKDANKAKAAVDALADELAAIVRPEEDRIDGIIKAREAEIEAERQERAIAEAARIKAHRDAIERIVGFERHAQGLTAERVAIGIALLEGVSTGPEFEEFEAEATKVKADTMTAMRALHERTVAAEAQAAELAELRAEKARRDEAERIEHEAAEQRQREAQQAASADRQLIEQIADVRTTPLGHSNVPAESITVEDTANTRPPINLTEIARRLGFPLTRSFIEDALGIPPSMTVKASVLWPGGAWGAIKAGLLKHIEAAE